VRLAGAVLTGGRSSRMGRTKALLAVDGVPMARRVADALGAVGCAPVVLAGGDPEELGPLGLRVVPDVPPGGHGPLAGVRAVLDDLVVVADAVVVAPCDVPGLGAAVLEPLIAAFDRSRPDVAVARTTRLEPGVAVWSTACRDDVARALAGGVRAVHRVLDDLRTIEVPVPGPLVNVNAPGDLPG
jgi:molybdopterin-guanine dinucleotide biosynthesis protein A